MPAYNLLRYKPNPAMTASVFKKTLQGHALLDGNGYAYIKRRGDGSPVELWPLLPRQVTPIRINGSLWYVYDFLNGDQRKIPAEDILHIKGFSYDGLIGYNLIHKARESLGWAMAMQTYGAVFFRNNATPRVVLEHPGHMKTEAAANLRSSWERLHAGLENAHRTAVLEEGMKASVLSISARDAQLIDQMKFTYIDVANWLCLPPHKVGGEGRTAYASLEQENQAYLDDCLDGWLVGWEEECWDKLLTEEQKESGEYEIRFSRRELLRANLDARGAFYVQMMQWGVMSPDEVRHEEGANPQEKGIGKVYFRPMNMGLVDAATGEIKVIGGGKPAGDAPPEKTPTDAPAEPPAEPAKPGDDGSAARMAHVTHAVGMMLGDAVARMVKRVGHQADRAATDYKKFGVWLEGIEANNGHAIREAMQPAESALAGMGQQGGVGEWLIRRLEHEFTALTERCTPRELPSKAAALAQELATTLPKLARETFLRCGGPGSGVKKIEAKIASAKKNLEKLKSDLKDAKTDAKAIKASVKAASSKPVDMTKVDAASAGLKDVRKTDLSKQTFEQIDKAVASASKLSYTQLKAGIKDVFGDEHGSSLIKLGKTKGGLLKEVSSSLKERLENYNRNPKRS